MKIKRSILWAGGSAIVLWLAFLGLIALSSIDGPGQSGFYFSLVLCFVLWISYFTTLISGLTWMASVLFPVERR